MRLARMYSRPRRLSDRIISAPWSSGTRPHRSSRRTRSGPCRSGGTRCRTTGSWCHHAVRLKLGLDDLGHLLAQRAVAGAVKKGEILPLAVVEYAVGVAILPTVLGQQGQPLGRVERILVTLASPRTAVRRRHVDILHQAAPWRPVHHRLPVDTVGDGLPDLGLAKIGLPRHSAPWRRSRRSPGSAFH